VLDQAEYTLSDSLSTLKSLCIVSSYCIVLLSVCELLRRAGVNVAAKPSRTVNWGKWTPHQGEIRRLQLYFEDHTHTCKQWALSPLNIKLDHQGTCMSEGPVKVATETETHNQRQFTLCCLKTGNAVIKRHSLDKVAWTRLRWIGIGEANLQNPSSVSLWILLDYI